MMAAPILKRAKFVWCTRFDVENNVAIGGLAVLLFPVMCETDSDICPESVSSEPSARNCFCHFTHIVMPSAIWESPVQLGPWRGFEHPGFGYFTF